MVNLKVTLGVVNYTNYIHVTASKVSTPSVVVWEDWIDVPITNLNFVIPNLDVENYYIRYYDAATNVAVGTLVLELLVNALTGDTISERRFYLCGGSNPSDPIDGANVITDSYLVGKDISGVFKEGFRYLRPTDEYVTDNVLGTVTIVNGTTLSTAEVLIVEITYKVSSTSTPTITGGLYNGNLNITESTRTLLSSEVQKRLRCVGSVSTQVITLPLLAVVPEDIGFYFDNSCGGVAIQVRILTNGADRINYNGFMTSSNLFSEFWVSKGEKLLLKKITNGGQSYWEVIDEYKGVDVGSRMASGYELQAGWHSEDNTISNAADYPRLWWWINNVLSASRVITDDIVMATGIRPLGKDGLFVKNTAGTQFRWPNGQNISERGLKDFNNFGSDTDRLYDYPGGVQLDAVKSHKHEGAVGTLLTLLFGRGKVIRNIGQYGGTGSGFTDLTSDVVDTAGNAIASSENRVKNIGVVYMRKI